MVNYENYITLVGIIDRLQRNPILDKLSEEEAIDYAVDCIKLLGTDKYLLNDSAILDVSNYRAALPQNYVSIEHLRVVDKDADKSRINARPSTDTYHYNAKNESELDQSVLQDFTFNIRGNFVYTSFKEGKIEIAYKSLLMNEGGELMIPDSFAAIKAIENYIAYQHLLGLWGIGKIPDKVMSKYEQEYLWYIGKAQSDINNMNLSQRESLSDQMTQMFDNRDHRGEFYKNQSLPEYKRNHTY